QGVANLVAAARPGGTVSVLTRNRAGLAMRAGMTGRWADAVRAFDAHTYRNRVGVDDARADEPGEVAAALTSAGATVTAWYGVRLWSDHLDGEPPAGPDLAALLAAEAQAGRRDPYRAVCALTHTLAVVQ
ncbi:MAG TPA: hypothetical protein VKV06_00140, partial [Acidimicrobiales bacterium]|nr:hypothetical protein [Acidimicrobiales bacterium]